jgi:hypothetical protein
VVTSRWCVLTARQVLACWAVVALAAGCAGAPSAAAPAGSPTATGSPAALGPVRGFRVALQREAHVAGSPRGVGRVSWRVHWRLSWAAVPGATRYAVFYGTDEGTDPGPRTVRAERFVVVEVAAGTSRPQRMAAEQRAAILFTSSQLLVSVSARDGGRSGPRSPWFPVGDVPRGGVPIATPGLGRHAG